MPQHEQELEHELVTDLTVVLGYLEMAAAGQVTIETQAARMLLERSRRVADRLVGGRPPSSDHLFHAGGLVGDPHEVPAPRVA